MMATDAGRTGSVDAHARPPDEDEEFDRLLAASSVGAPVVTELAARTPVSVATRLRHQVRRRVVAAGAFPPLTAVETADGFTGPPLPARLCWPSASIIEWLPSILRGDLPTVLDFPATAWEALWPILDLDRAAPQERPARAGLTLAAAMTSEEWLSAVWDLVPRLEELSGTRIRRSVALGRTGVFPRPRPPVCPEASGTRPPAGEMRQTEIATRVKQPPAPDPDHSDGLLVRRLIDGDITALEALYDRYVRPAYSLARRITGDPVFAEEVVQEVFLALWKDPARYDCRRGGFPSWLLAATHHKAVDAVRRNQTDRTRRSQLAQEAEWYTSSHLTAADLPPAEDAAWSGLRGERVRKALATLPPPQREALVLAYYAGYTQSEIAERTGEPLGTVKTRMLAGMRRLRGLLDEAQDGSLDWTGPRPGAVTAPPAVPAGRITAGPVPSRVPRRGSVDPDTGNLSTPVGVTSRVRALDRTVRSSEERRPVRVAAPESAPDRRDHRSNRRRGS